MRRHKIKVLSQKEADVMFPKNLINLRVEVCIVCGAIRQDTFFRGKDSVWLKDGERKPYCEVK